MVDRPFVRDTYEHCCTKKNMKTQKGKSRDIFLWERGKKFN